MRSPQRVVFLTPPPVMCALLDSQKELMFDLLGRVEEKRNEIAVCALEEDFEVPPHETGPEERRLVVHVSVYI